MGCPLLRCSPWRGPSLAPTSQGAQTTGGHYTFPRFPNGGITVRDSSDLSAPPQPLQMPMPTVGAAAAASSSAAGFLASPIDLKLVLQSMTNVGERLARYASQGGLDNLATCTDGALDHTRSGCRYPSSRFIDGTFTDNNALAILVGHLQRKHPGSRLRIACHVSTECASQGACADAATAAAADYFDTSAGNSNWCPDCAVGDLPAPPRQIFEGLPPPTEADPLTAMAADTPQWFSYVHGANLTTVENAMYGVQAGTKVDLLFLMANTGGEGGNIFSTSNATTAAYAALADQAYQSIEPVIRGFYERGVVEYVDSSGTPLVF